MIRVDETDPVGEVEPSFPYRDVTIRRGVDFKDNYDIQSEIGRGKFGTVYHCKEKTSGLLLAAKVVTTTRKEDRRSVEREVEIMRRLQHPRLIQLYDAIDTGKQIYVILELIQGGELFERVIDDDFVLTERSCAVFMRQICEGIEFVHAQHILHLDMKPENILCLTKEGNRIKIIDFGLARHYDPRKKMQVLFGTPEFVAPEVVNFDQIGFGTDMWSIGVICYVLLSGLSPFMGDTDVETMANVTIAKYDFDHDAFADISEDAKDFIRCLLVKDKEKRATATMCRSHRWLASKSPATSKSVNEAITPRIETTRPETPTKGKKVANVSRGQIASSSKDELDVTKDNLRLFVERWREHPDSPYLLETELQCGVGQQQTASQWDDRGSVTASADHNLELISLRGQSPSPCGSVCSTASGISDTPTEQNNYMLAVPNSVVLGLERRASEGYSANAGHRRDQAAQIELAEEIIKLSEHLRNLAMGQPIVSLSPENGTGSNGRSIDTNRVTGKSTGISFNGYSDSGLTKKTTNDKWADGARIDNRTNGTSFSQQSSNISFRESVPVNTTGSHSNEISEKLSSITRQRKVNGTTFNGSRSYDRQENNISSFSLKKTLSKSRRSEESSFFSASVNNTAGNDRNEKISSEAAGDKCSRVSWKLDINDQQPRASIDPNDNNKIFNNRDIDLTPPWRRARTKHRFGETCRDVPRISNLRDIHKNLNLDEPTSTKDLLLHLLGEWDDSTRPSGGIGRKSVSVDWGGEQSAARRSMNSLAEYFQSEQQKSTSSDVGNEPSSSAPPIHR